MQKAHLHRHHCPQGRLIASKATFTREAGHNSLNSKVLVSSQTRFPERSPDGMPINERAYRLRFAKRQPQSSGFPRMSRAWCRPCNTH